jgi:hypothetical protein
LILLMAVGIFIGGALFRAAMQLIGRFS